MDKNLLLLYLSILLALLAVAAVLVARQIFKTRRIESTLSRLQNKLTKEQGTAKEYYELGSIFLDKKIFSQAITLLQKALKAEDLEEGDSALVYNALGYAYFAQEQYDLAIRQYKDAIKVQPNYVTAYNNMGHAYERKQMTPQALEAYEEALRLDPTNATAKRRADSLRKRMVPSA